MIFLNNRSIKSNLFSQLSLLTRARCIFSFIGLLLIPCIATATPTLYIVSDDRIPIYKKISQSLEQYFTKDFPVKIIQQYKSSRQQLVLANPALIITLGIDASNLAPTSSIPTLHTLISKKRSKTLTKKNSYSIYLDQPLTRQLNLLTLLLPKKTKVGVLTAEFSKNKLKKLKQESIKLNLSLNNRTVSNTSTLNRQLNELTKDINVLFTLPDPLIHNRHSIANLLLATYSHNIPVIGFSKSYVTAGAIAAVYSSPKQITQHIHELARQILSPLLSSSPPFSPQIF